MEDRPRRIIKRLTKDITKYTDYDFTQDKCAKCGMRIGSHTLRESWKCGLITKAEYIKNCGDDEEDEEIDCRYCGAKASVPCDETKCPFRICNRIDREQNKNKQ